jgi:Spy/CpxP family protein refolding chaperone
MKTRTFLTHLVVASTLLCTAAFQANAQAPGGGAGGGRGFGVLTEDQRTKMREAMQGAQSEFAPLNEKLAAAQKEALKAALTKAPDTKVVQAKVEAVAKIQTEIAMLRLKVLKDVLGSLTDEQKTQIDERAGMNYGMFLGGGFGGFGGGMGGAGGQRRGGGGGGGGNN